MTICKIEETHYKNSSKITEAEYNSIREIILKKPVPPAGYDYRLTDALEWELHELSTTGPEELTAEEALEIITGGAGNA